MVFTSAVFHQVQKKKAYGTFKHIITPGKILYCPSLITDIPQVMLELEAFPFLNIQL